MFSKDFTQKYTLETQWAIVIYGFYLESDSNKLSKTFIIQWGKIKQCDCFLRLNNCYYLGDEIMTGWVCIWQKSPCLLELQVHVLVEVIQCCKWLQNKYMEHERATNEWKFHPEWKVQKGLSPCFVSIHICLKFSPTQKFFRSWK